MGRLICFAWLALTSGGVSAQEVVYYHTDPLGSPVAITDSAGLVVERSEYEPYGSLLNHELTDGPGFSGHVGDLETGLSYMQQRYYDPEIGGFLSIDPVEANGENGENFNRYKYALNNPYRFTDLDGRCESISTCQMMRDDLDVAAGRMSPQERADRQEARGAGALIGAAMVTASVGPQAGSVRSGLLTAGLDAIHQAADQMADGKSFDEVSIDGTDVAISGVVGAFAPGFFSTAKTVRGNIGAIRALRGQAGNTVARAAKIAQRIGAHMKPVKSAIGAWLGFKIAKDAAKRVINEAQKNEEKKK